MYPTQKALRAAARGICLRRRVIVMASDSTQKHTCQPKGTLVSTWYKDAIEVRGTCQHIHLVATKLNQSKSFSEAFLPSDAKRSNTLTTTPPHPATL